MTLYLLRHAEAEALAASDHARRLTPKGEEQAERTGKFCRRPDVLPEVILSSPVTRALQTAKIVQKSFSDSELIEVPWAACGMDPDTARDELRAYAKLNAVMLVGHQPDLGHLAATLLGCDNAGSLHVRKSLLCAIDLSPDLRHGVLEFFIPAKLMA
ncbi:MAG: phosphohistidine phosphatase SixA [Chthoniobacterales bacterium]